MFRPKEDTSHLPCLNAAAGLAMTTSSFEVAFRFHNYPEANCPEESKRRRSQQVSAGHWWPRALLLLQPAATLPLIVNAWRDDAAALCGTMG
jgi:hypothetical protein